MIHGEAKMLRRRAAAMCPDVKAIRRLLEEATDATWGSQARLAELLGCSPWTIRRWERGTKRPSAAYTVRLRELERRLRERPATINEELRGVAKQEDEASPTKTERPLPLTANAVSVRVEGEQALVSFTLKVPGEKMAREVVEVLVPTSSLLHFSLPDAIARMNG